MIGCKTGAARAVDRKKRVPRLDLGLRKSSSSFFGYSGIEMFIKAAAIQVVLASSAGLSVATEPFEARDFERRSPTAMQSFAGERSVTTLQPQQLARPVHPPAPHSRADLVNGRSLGTHARDLLQFVIYASIGNRDGMEILSDRLRKFGVTREQLQDFVDHTKLHYGVLPRLDRPASDID
jgi:hypothetical protein